MHTHIPGTVAVVAWFDPGVASLQTVDDIIKGRLEDVGQDEEQEQRGPQVKCDNILLYGGNQ